MCVSQSMFCVSLLQMVNNFSIVMELLCFIIVTAAHYIDLNLECAIGCCYQGHHITR